ncbi:MAG: pyridoxamine 5'-phosphate oxidase family protein [Candidatus Omnitrophica bacterium]|nr:pyridoxamine 5'-phosphate oxidase family protein [Candidatus Omnitrophota bacterium]
MIKLSDDIRHFLEKQGFVIVSTLDEQGTIHCSAKGIIGIEAEGRIYLIDLYRSRTFHNLTGSPTVSITAVDEHHFVGYTLKGKAEIVEREKIKRHIIKKWEERVIQRISKRLIQSVKTDKKSSAHPESRFPQPQYLIVVNVEEIVDLAPGHLKSL